MSVSVGEMVPDFTLVNQFGSEVALSSYRGVSPVVVVFFPFAFSGICTGELCELRDSIDMFKSQGVELLAVSIDTKYTLAKFAEAEGYDFQLLSDFWPHGAVAKQFGVFLEEKGFATRGTFVINKTGELVAKFITSPGEPRDLAAYKKALELL